MINRQELNIKSDEYGTGIDFGEGNRSAGQRLYLPTYRYDTLVHSAYVWLAE